MIIGIDFVTLAQAFSITVRTLYRPNRFSLRQYDKMLFLLIHVTSLLVWQELKNKVTFEGLQEKKMLALSFNSKMQYMFLKKKKVAEKWQTSSGLDFSFKVDWLRLLSASVQFCFRPFTPPRSQCNFLFRRQVLQLQKCLEGRMFDPLCCPICSGWDYLIMSKCQNKTLFMGCNLTFDLCPCSPS